MDADGPPRTFRNSRSANGGFLVFIMSAVAASLASSACRSSMRALNVATTS